MQLRPYPNKSGGGSGGRGNSTYKGNGVVYDIAKGKTNNAESKIATLQGMSAQTGSKEAIGNTIAVYHAEGKINDNEAAYMFEYFGFDPDDWLEEE